MESLPFWNIWPVSQMCFPKEKQGTFVKNIHNKLEVSRSICPEVSGTARFFFLNIRLIFTATKANLFQRLSNYDVPSFTPFFRAKPDSYPRGETPETLKCFRNVISMHIRNSSRTKTLPISTSHAFLFLVMSPAVSLEGSLTSFCCTASSDSRAG